MSNPTPPFTPEVVAAVTAHMNTDHPEDNLLIARSLGGVPDATGATMADVSPAGATFRVTDADGERDVTVPGAVGVTERVTIRHEVVRMYHEACEALGLTPRGAEEH